MAILSLGVLLLLGYLFGSVAGKFGLPKILGYLFAGLILNPQSYICYRYFRDIDTCYQLLFSIYYL